jgi:hypothetical protein
MKKSKYVVMGTLLMLAIFLTSGPSYARRKGVDHHPDIVTDSVKVGEITK